MATPYTWRALPQKKYFLTSKVDTRRVPGEREQEQSAFNNLRKKLCFIILYESFYSFVFRVLVMTKNIFFFSSEAAQSAA